MTISVGIDDLNLYGSTLSVDFAEIASARGGSANKNLQNVRFIRRSVVPIFEDPVTLAVNAAKPLIDASRKEDFELLIVATETGLDYGKPLSTYVHKYLDLKPRCRNFEIKHACYAGTSALQMAASWIRSGVRPGKKALVVMTDIGRRHFQDPGEFSIGAGAIALSISAEPRVLVLESYNGIATNEVYDTARPTNSFEWIDSILSLSSYLDLVEMAWDDYRHAVGKILFEKHFAYISYHTPLLSLIEKAHQSLVETDNEDATRDEITGSFERMVKPGLRYNLETANIYSGSLYVALAGLLEFAPNIDSGTRIGCFSYGSGACSEFFSGLVGKEANAIVSSHQIGERLAARKQLSFEEYETAVLELEYTLQQAEFSPNKSMHVPIGHYEQAYEGKGLLVLEGVKNYYRNYKWS